MLSTMNEIQKGFIPVMLTPFKSNGDIDYTGLTALTEFYLASGARGLFANCLSSEMFFLSPSERIKLTQHIVDVTQSRVPVVATGTFERPVEQQADFVKSMYDVGVQSVIITTSMMADKHENDTVLIKRIDQLLTLTDPIPMGFYECPVPYKRVLSPELLEQFIATGRIKYHKDTCLDIDQVKSKIRLAASPSFGLYDAYAVHAVDSLKAGAAGLSCIQGNYFPELIVWLCENYTNPAFISDVCRLQNFLIQHMDIVHDNYPVAAKYFLQKRGVPITTVAREQGGVLTTKLTQKLDRFYRVCQEFQESLALELAMVN